MSSPVAVCNKALALLGANVILSLEDNQTEAIVCKAVYDAVRDKVLEDRAWTFATGRGVPVADSTPPAFGYTYRFLIPSDVIRVVNVGTPVSNSTIVTLTPINWAREGDYVLTHQKNIGWVYIKRAVDLSLWSPAALDAFSYALAAEIAVALTDNSSITERLLAGYESRITDAGATDGAQGTAQQLRATRLKRGR